MKSAARLGRARFPLRDELLLVALPTVTVLIVFRFVEEVTRQRLLFASLASSAFLIYLDPQHGTNQVRTLIIAQLLAAILGHASLVLLGPGYPAAAAAMIVTITLLVSLDLVHPPAVSTCLAFAFQDTKQASLPLFALAVGIVAVLVLLERVSLYLLKRAMRRADKSTALT